MAREGCVNNFEDRLKFGALLQTVRPNSPFFKQQSAEIDQLFKDYAEKLTAMLFNGEAWKPPPLPRRWSGEWWRMHARRVRWRLRDARQRVGLWIGGIDPAELDCDC